MSTPDNNDSIAQVQQIKFEHLMAMYSENAEVARVFFEWRHKVISLYLFAVGAIFFFAGWLYDHSEFRKFVFLSFLLGALVSGTLALMDQVNTRILSHCYRIGNDFENEMRPGKGAIYSAFRTRFENCLSYYKILCVVYWGSTAILSP